MIFLLSRFKKDIKNFQVQQKLVSKKIKLMKTKMINKKFLMQMNQKKNKKKKRKR